MAEQTSIIESIRAAFGQAVLSAQQYRGQATIVIPRESLVPLARHLRQDPALAFDLLMDLSAVDYLKFGRAQSSAPTLTTPSPLPYYMTPAKSAEAWERGVSQDDYRFDVVYHFYSTVHNHRLRVRVPVASTDPSVPSVTALWRAANWFEREIWDMFGIRFTGHPNLKRLLMYEPFDGHPLRKDYPVRRRQPRIGPVN